MRSLLSLVLFGSCAVIWLIKAIRDTVQTINQVVVHSPFNLILCWICEIVWIGVFIIQLKKFLSDNQ